MIKKTQVKNKIIIGVDIGGIKVNAGGVQGDLLDSFFE